SRTSSSTSLLSHSHLFFFHLSAPTDLYTLSLHDALPISLFASANSQCRAIRSPASAKRRCANARSFSRRSPKALPPTTLKPSARDRKSTRLNSSHDQISYAVFCLKKKKKKNTSDHLLFHT